MWGIEFVDQMNTRSAMPCEVTLSWSASGITQSLFADPFSELCIQALLLSPRVVRGVRFCGRYIRLERLRFRMLCSMFQNRLNCVTCEEQKHIVQHHVVSN